MLYGNGVFFLAREATTQEPLEKRISVGGVHILIERSGGTRDQGSPRSVFSFLPSLALMPQLLDLGKVISLATFLLLGWQDSSICHCQTFHHQFFIIQLAGEE